ncbi:CHAT domain-containing protein [Halalkalicoccus ordinarius]|uniref:hypothetical protein n=1 Tax=Halalkalicoccus ordinarius TaxID=3116651 RepID=UPI00300F1A89
MIDWEVTTAGLRVSDRSAAVEISAPDWGEFYAGGTLPRPVDTTVSGQVSKLAFGTARATVTSLNDDESYGSLARGRTELSSDRYLLSIDTPIETAVRFDGPATLSAPDQSLEVTLDDRQTVTLGFRSQLRRPEATVTVPDDPAGLARAVSHLHAGFETTGPERSIPALRGHPPRIEYGETSIPERVRDATADTGIEIVVPDDHESVLVTAPLAYYLQAAVTVEPGATPTLRAPAVGLERELEDVEAAVESLLRRTFYLDCCCRRAGPLLAGLPDPSDLGLDPVALEHASPAERLHAYLEGCDDGVDDEVPDWHLSTSLSMEPETALALPYLLDRLSLIHRPRTRSLDGKELLKRSLTDFYRRPEARPAVSVDVVRPQSTPGRSHAWIDDTTPIDVFSPSTRAFENALAGLDTDGRLPFIVVGNDPEMAEECREVARIYEERTARLPIDVTVHHGLTREELSQVFQRRSAFVHYIGHCDVDGLRCTDGNLATESIPESNAQTFFLNACGSYYEGRSLIERGSVAGGVTFSKVLNEQAATVGTTFARLLLAGFSIDRAMQLARRQIMMGKNYAVVGDGTHVLGGRRDRHPGTVVADRTDEDRFAITYDVLPNWTAGSWYYPEGMGTDRPHLLGTTTESTLDRSSFLEMLESIDAPVVYDGQFFWPEELATQLRVRVE